MMRDEARTALKPFGRTGDQVPFAHLNDDSHEDGVVVEIRAQHPKAAEVGFGQAQRGPAALTLNQA